MNKIEKLELKHLCGYLPYELKCKIESNYDQWIKDLVLTIHSINGYQRTIKNNMRYDDRRIIEFVEDVMTSPFIWEIKPLLFPLSALDTQMLINDLHGKMSDAIFDWIDYFNSDSANKDVSILCAPYQVIEWCFKNHIDIYSLIDSGLAIDKRTV